LAQATLVEAAVRLKFSRSTLVAVLAKKDNNHETLSALSSWQA